MTDIQSEAIELPQSAYLAHTLRRARSTAEQRSQRYITLEHFLLALLDDPDAASLLTSINADVANIRSAVATEIGQRRDQPLEPLAAGAAFSYKFEILMLLASSDAARLGRQNIDGAFALVALAKDPDSIASQILARNGFAVRPALTALGASPEPFPEVERKASLSIPSLGGDGFKPLPPLGIGSDGETAKPIIRPGSPVVNEITKLEQPVSSAMANMLANVRDIIDRNDGQEHGKEAALPPVLHEKPQTMTRPAQRLEPRFDPLVSDGRAAGPALSAQPRRPASRGDLAANPVSRAGSTQPGAEGSPADAMPPEPETKPRRRKKAGEALLDAPARQLLSSIPRTMRVAKVQNIGVSLTKEDCDTLFAGLGQSGGHAGEYSVTRAVTIEAAAPDGGFIIVRNTPATQWIFDRPSFLGKEPFGHWSWTLVPNEAGRQSLVFTIGARAIDGNGLAGDLSFEPQSHDIRVRTNILRTVWKLSGTLFWIAFGAAISGGALYGLKLLDKLPRP